MQMNVLTKSLALAMQWLLYTFLYNLVYQHTASPQNNVCLGITLPCCITQYTNPMLLSACERTSDLHQYHC